jgi:Tfp pilus assembly protein PilN
MRPVNLVPQDQRRRAPSESTGKGAYLVLGLLAVLFVMAAVYVHSSNQVIERESRAAAAEAEANRLEAVAADRNTFADFAQIAQTRLASVAGVAETRFDWERLIRELARIVPEGSWLQSTDASVLGDPTAAGTPTATSTTSTAVPVGPSANLVGCTPDQSDVAQIMARLRQIHRVSEVTLNESAQELGGGPASVDACGSLYKFDLTVSFEATPPAREAPRGATRVPASLGGGS